MLPSPDLMLARAEMRLFKAVFPDATNHNDTLLGGTTLHLMDEVATRLSRLKMVMGSSNKADFTQPIPGGTLVKVLGNVVRRGITGLLVRVKLFVEQMHSDEQQLAVANLFTCVAADERRRPVPVRPAAALPPVLAA